MEKRSSSDGFAQGDLFGPASVCTNVGRVGGRQGKGPRSTGGGGYLKNCGPQNFRIPKPPPPDPRFLELEKIGIAGAWLRLARRVGFDTFLEIWRQISEDEATRHDGGRRMPKLREFDAYLKYQRNLYIFSLADLGMNPTQIQRALRSSLCEHLCIEHVQVIMKKRVKSPPA